MSSSERPLLDPNTPAGGVPRRRALATLAGLALLAGCGFTPAYAPGGPGTRLRGKVALQSPKSADQFAFNDRLIERLGPASAPAYRLSSDLTISATPQIRGFDKVVARYALAGTVDYRLTEIATGRTAAEGRASDFAAYEVGSDTVSGLADEADARARLAVMLADQVVTRLLAALS